MDLGVKKQKQSRERKDRRGWHIRKREDYEYEIKLTVFAAENLKGLDNIFLHLVKLEKGDGELLPIFVEG